MTRVMHPHFFVAKFRMLFATFTGCIFSPLQIFLQPLVHCMGTLQSRITTGYTLTQPTTNYPDIVSAVLHSSH